MNNEPDDYMTFIHDPRHPHYDEDTEDGDEERELAEESAAEDKIDYKGE